jgi:hypothetical protein
MPPAEQAEGGLSSLVKLKKSNLLNKSNYERTS